MGYRLSLCQKRGIPQNPPKLNLWAQIKMYGLSCKRESVGPNKNVGAVCYQ